MAPIAPLIRTLRPTALAAAAIAFAGLGLQGCSIARTAFGPLQYDKTSPAAGAIAATSARHEAYPSLIDVPSQPTDVRPVTAWNRNIFEVLAGRRQVDAYQVTFPQTLYGAEAFVQQSKIEATPPPPSAAAVAAAKADAARATPPSPTP